MKKNKLDDVNIMEGIDFKKAQVRQAELEKARRIKAQARQAKIEKTRRIQEQERLRKQRTRKILLTVEVIVLSAIIYVLTGEFGELAKGSTFYQIMCILSWAWLLFGQIGALYTIWCDENEN